MIGTGCCQGEIVIFDLKMAVAAGISHPVQDQFQNKLGTKIGQYQGHIASQHPGHRDPPTPAPEPMPPEDQAENDPCQDREHGFMNQVLGEDVFQKAQAGYRLRLSMKNPIVMI